MQKYRITLTQQRAQTIEIYAENGAQAWQYGEELRDINMDVIQQDNPSLAKLILYYSPLEDDDDWEVQSVEEFR